MYFVYALLGSRSPASTILTKYLSFFNFFNFFKFKFKFIVRLSFSVWARCLRFEAFAAFVLLSEVHLSILS